MTFTDAWLVFLPEVRSTEAVQKWLRSAPDLAGLSLSAEPGQLKFEEPQVIVRVHLLTERADLKKWMKGAPEKATGKAMALRIDYSMEESYRGERWQFSGPFGGAAFEFPLLAVRIRNRLTEGEGWSLVNIYRWPRFRML